MSAVTEKPALERPENMMDLMQLSTAEIDRRYRQLLEQKDDADLRVSWLANHTIDPLMRATAVVGAGYGLHLDCTAGPFDQHFQELLDENSATRKNAPDVIVLALSLRQLAPKLVYGSGNINSQMVDEEIQRVIATINDWLNIALANSRSQLFICNFIRPASARFSAADPSLAAGEQSIYSTLNQRLAALVQDQPRANVIDVNHAAACAGLSAGWNPRMYHLAKMEWNSGVILRIAQRLARACRALKKPAKKCLVVDLDNTLWGGVLGEEGPQGIRIGQGDPTGECFSAFQSALLDIKARGIVLAICSKNNLPDVEEAFRVRQDMPMSFDDFACHAINWEPKHDNIKKIADALNIGINSLAFIDDNPVECELVRQTLPEVLTLELPRDPAVLADFIYEIPEFDKLELTEEDSNKTTQYAENFKRSALKESVSDMSDFLQSLETELHISAAKASDVTRIHQLFTKTNQFNLTTIRYDAGDISGFIESSECHLHTVRAKDKFGDLGMIGVYLLRQGDDQVDIDSFVMSCRALGRGIETATCNTLKQFVFDSLASSRLTARFSPTAKNKPAADFYQRQGFGTIDDSGDDDTLFTLGASDSEQIDAPGISIEFKRENNE